MEKLFLVGRHFFEMVKNNGTYIIACVTVSLVVLACFIAGLRNDSEGDE